MPACFLRRRCFNDSFLFAVLHLVVLVQTQAKKLLDLATKENSLSSLILLSRAISEGFMKAALKAARSQSIGNYWEAKCQNWKKKRNSTTESKANVSRQDNSTVTSRSSQNSFPIFLAGIPKVYAAGQIGLKYYMIMEWLDSTLEDLVKRNGGTFTMRTVCKIGHKMVSIPTQFSNGSVL